MLVARRKSLILAATAVTAAALGGCQRSEAAPPSIVAPMQLLNSRPVVDAEIINAEGEAHRVRLLVDTRDRGVIFSAAAAKRAKLQRGEREQVGGGVYERVDAKAVRIGRVRLETAGVEPLVEVDSSDDALAGVDGLVGAQVLKQYGRVTLNFTAGRLVLGESPDAPVLGSHVPTAYDDGAFTARITLGTTTHRLPIDTSSVTTHIREDVPIRVTGTRQGVWGRVVLAPFEVVSDPDFRGGLLGANLLGRYTVRIDYDRETVRVSTT